MAKKPLTTADAAEILRVSPSRVRQLCLAGELDAERFGRDWAINPASVARYVRAAKSGQASRKMGRPMKCLAGSEKDEL